MDLKFDYKISGKILKDGAGCVDIMHAELGKAFEEGTAFVMKNVLHGTPVFQGDLSRSIQREWGGEMLNLHGKVYSNSSYVGFIETGLPAHYPEFGSLAEWVRLKLGYSGRAVFAVTRAVGRKIGVQGIKGRFMFKDGLEKSQNYLNQIFKNAEARIANLISKD